MKLHVIYHTKDEKTAFFNALLASGAPALVRQEEGCLFYEYVPAKGSANELHLYEAWTTPEAQKVHITQPHMQVIGALKKQYVDKVELLQMD